MVNSRGSARLAKACNICRKKKTRCDGGRPACVSCRAFDLPCTYADGSRQRKKSKLEKRVDDLAHNLRRATSKRWLRSESTGDELGTSTLSPENQSSDETSVSSIAHQNAPSPPIQNDQSVLHSPVGDEGDGESYALKNNNGAMRFFGASSGFSGISPTEARVEGQTDPSSLHNVIRQGHNKWGLVDWYPQGLRGETWLETGYSQPLPPKPLLLDLVEEYFGTFNRALPVFNQKNFMKLVHRQCSWNPNPSPSWWAVLNIVLALAYRNRAEQSGDGGDGGDGWHNCMGHVKNAISVISELYMRTCDLLAVQAMICLALFFQGTPNPQPLFAFTATAIRFSQSIGLHRSKSFGLSRSQVEERQRVFWIAFILDADVCLRTGRPATQDIRDFDVPLPADCPSDGLGMIECCEVELNLLTTLSKFALVQRKVYNSLYTAEALQRSVLERVAEAEHCLEEINLWKEGIPHGLKPRRNFSAIRGPFLRHLLRLHFASHCCYLSIYRICLLSQQPLRAELGAELSEVARSALSLASYVDKERLGQSFDWSIAYFPAAAIVALLSQETYHHHCAEADSDLSLIDKTLRFLSRLADEEPDTYVDHILSVCSGFRNTAREKIKLAKVDAPQAVDGSQPVLESSSQSLRPDNFLEEARSPGGNGHNYPEPFDLSSNIFWSWQDMLTGVPPGLDFDTQGFCTENNSPR